MREDLWKQALTLTFLTILLGLLLVIYGCQSPTGPTIPQTERQIWITGRVHTYATVAGVTIDSINFSKPPTRRDGIVAAGWVECPRTGNRNVIWFNDSYLESGPRDYLDGVAAHEVCHIYYKENEWPCVADERRASVCGDGLMRGIHP